jgi:hypothetical protein
VRSIEGFFPEGRDNWYFWPLPEGQLFGQMLVYEGLNDADSMMFWGRLTNVLLTLAIGVLILLWVWSVSKNGVATLLALALWVFHPVALGYGHLITSDICVAFGMGLAIMLFARLEETPTVRAAVFCGLATGLALLLKMTAILLAPIFIVLLAIHWRRLKNAKIGKLALVVVASAWALVMVVYFPRWGPAPALPEAQALALGVPGWFTGLRVLLIPPDFFKVLALTLGHAKVGHESYLLGEWSQFGWWYYYPLAFFLKSPLAFVILTLLATISFLKVFKGARPLESAPWIAAAVYVGVAMTSKVNIGVRHLLPIFPLLMVGIGCAIPRLKQWLVGGLVAWQVIICLLCAPLYLQFFSEAVGGADNGYKYLIDSNYDWGQDAKRLKAFLDERHIGQIYLDYFGTQFSIEYLKIPNTRIDAEKARQIRQGWLVVSASELMRPEWSWLRETHPPTARVADTLFVYQFP